MIFCKELDKEFESEKDMFKALKANKHDIISFKKAEVLESRNRGRTVNVQKTNIQKYSEQIKGLDMDENKYYIVVNTTKILDSHRDLHKNGIWNKTVKEQQGKNALVADHELKVFSTIVHKEDIEMKIMNIPFSAIGKNYEGETQALVYVFDKTAVQQDFVKNWLDSKKDIEASVRMQYVKIQLAVNEPDDEEYKEEYKVYLDNIDTIANKDDFDQINYFWVVTEAKNVMESSLVHAGSNGATGAIQENKFQPSNDTDNKSESLEGTQKEEEVIEEEKSLFDHIEEIEKESNPLNFL